MLRCPNPTYESGQRFTTLAHRQEFRTSGRIALAQAAIDVSRHGARPKTKPAASCEPAGQIRSEVAPSGAEEARTAVADHIAPTVDQRTAGPVAARAADRIGPTIFVRLIAGDGRVAPIVARCRGAIGRTAVADRAADDRAGREAADDPGADAATAAARLSGRRNDGRRGISSGRGPSSTGLSHA